jgi:hypothetical protein
MNKIKLSNTLLKELIHNWKNIATPQGVEIKTNDGRKFRGIISKGNILETFIPIEASEIVSLQLVED